MTKDNNKTTLICKTKQAFYMKNNNTSTNKKAIQGYRSIVLCEQQTHFIFWMQCILSGQMIHFYCLDMFSKLSYKVEHRTNKSRDNFNKTTKYVFNLNKIFPFVSAVN